MADGLSSCVGTSKPARSSRRGTPCRSTRAARASVRRPSSRPTTTMCARCAAGGSVSRMRGRNWQSSAWISASSDCGRSIWLIAKQAIAPGSRGSCRRNCSRATSLCLGRLPIQSPTQRTAMPEGAPGSTGRGYERVLVWFRRDLRAHDHAALSLALASSDAVYCAFVFDTEILDQLSERRDRRVEFICACIAELSETLGALRSALFVLHGRAREEIPALSERLEVQAVYANRDYEPATLERDRAVHRALLDHGITLHTCKDQVIFECDEVLTQAQRPFSVFTPYKQAWLARLRDAHLAPHPVKERGKRFASTST